MERKKLNVFRLLLMRVTITFYAKATGYCKRFKKIAKDNRNIDKTVAKN